MMQASILHRLATYSINGGGVYARVSTTTIRPALVAISALYSSTISNSFSNKASSELPPKTTAPDFTNDLTFAENAWTETEARIRKEALQSSLAKFKRETLAKDHAFDVNRTTSDHSTVSNIEETGNFLTKAEFDQTVRLDSSERAFDENDFPSKVTHVVKGKSKVVGKSEQKEVFEGDHAFDVNNNSKE